MPSVLACDFSEDRKDFDLNVLLCNLSESVRSVHAIRHG